MASRTCCGCAARSRSSIRWRGAARSSCGSCCNRDEPVRALGALTGNQAMQMVRAGPRGDLSFRLAGRRPTSNTAGAMYPDQSLYPANTGPELARKINRTLARADQVEHLEGGAKRDWFAPIVADAEAGFGGPLELLRDHEGLHRGGRRGRPLRGPAREREEVRPSRRQGADPDPGGDPQPRRRAARRRRLRRPDHPRRPHRCRKRQADHQRRRRARPPVPHRRADARGLLPSEGRHRPRPLHRPRPRLRPARRSAVVRDQPPEPRRGARLRRSDPRAISPASCSPTIARPSFNWAAKLDAETIARFQRELGRDGLQVPVRHAGRLPQPQPCDVRARLAITATAAWRLIPSSSRPSSRARPRATPRRATSAKSAPAISTRSRTAVSGGQASTVALSESTEAAQFE